ncbi:hypothetical protein EJ08DRAFT_699922 [Tothia fuscella]|uniref:Rhodopsin domain-containing protein n=1 Tax=Tothia fuscella TaxID=1048955 RepID=A0A9P4NLE6_9PEZI|nr:hypothetical protein EJ08DRAFT_699922 [Tothia fuscella]
MGNFDKAFVHELALNTWIMYGIGLTVLSLRFYASVRRTGWAGLRLDDYLMVVVALWYSMLIVCLNIIARGGGSNLFPPEDYPAFSPAEIQERIKGSKIVVVSEQAMLNVIYTLKSCLLILYWRLTSGTFHTRQVKYLSYYVAFGYIGTQVAFFTTCRPFTGYWAMPPPDPQCTTLQNYAIIQAVFNISSDLFMLAIPVPMIAKLRLPLKQKLGLCIVFSMGIFVIAAAVLTKIFNLSDIYSTKYTREASVAVYVANLPLIWPLLRDWIPILRGSSYNRSWTTPLPTIEDQSQRKPRKLDHILSMKTYHKEANGTRTSSTRDLTAQTPEQASPAASEKDTQRSISRGRTTTKDTTTLASPPPYSHSNDALGRFSGESRWDGCIVTKTTIEVDSYIDEDLRNNVDYRRKHTQTTPNSLKFENDQDKRGANREVTIEGGAAVTGKTIRKKRSKSNVPGHRHSGYSTD